MRYDICKVLTGDSKAYQEGVPNYVLRAMLPVELEKRVEKIKKEYVSFYPFTTKGGKLEDVKGSFYAEKPSTRKKQQIIRCHGWIGDKEEKYESKAAVGFSRDNLHLYYSCIEILSGHNTALINCATADYKCECSHNWYLDKVCIGNYVYDYQSLHALGNERISTLVVSADTIEEVNAFDELTNIQRDILKTSFIRPDYYVTATLDCSSTESKEFVPQIDNDGDRESYEANPIVLPHQGYAPIKLIIHQMAANINQVSIAPCSFDNISRWESRGISYNVFDSTDFLANKEKVLIKTQTK